MTEQSEHIVNQVDVVKSPFPQALMSCRANLDALIEVALHPGIMEEDIYRALAENLSARGIGFALVKLTPDGDHFWLKALFDPEGTSHFFGDITSIDEPKKSVKMKVEFFFLGDLPQGQSVLINSFRDLIEVEGGEYTAKILDAFEERPLIVSRLRHRDVTPHYLFLCGCDLDTEWIPDAEKLVEKLGKALEIVRLQEQLRTVEAKHERLFQSVKSGYLLVQIDGRIEQTNSSALSLLYLEREDLVGKNIFDVLPECRAWIGRDGRIDEGSESNRLEMEYHREVGKINYLLIEYHPISAAGDGSILIRINDLTERWRLDEIVRRLGKLKDGMAEHLSVGMILQDSHGFFAHVNETASRILGYRVEELLGGHWEMILPLDQQIIFRQATLRRMSGESNRYEIQLLHKNGKRVDVLLSESPYQENGHHAGTFTFITDLTHLRQAEAKILQQNRELHRALERLTALNQAASGALNALDAETIMAKVGEELRQLGMICLIATLDPKILEWVIQYVSAPLQVVSHAQQFSETVDIVRLPADIKDPWVLLLQSGETLFVEDPNAAVQGLVSHSAPFEIRMKGYEACPRILAPLSNGCRLSGVLVVCGEDLTAEDIPTVTAFANHLSIALEKARLSASTLAQAKLGQVLADLAAAANKESDMARLLETTGEMILSALGLPFGFFSLYDREKGSIHVLVSICLEQGNPREDCPLPGNCFSLDAHPILSKVFTTEQIVWNPITSFGSGTAGEGSAFPGTSILVPMLVSGKTIGLATLSLGETERQLSQDELTFLRTGVEQISVAFEKARLTAEAELKTQADHSLAALVEHTLASRDVDEVVGAAMRGVTDLIPSHFVCIAKLDLEGQIAEVLGVMGGEGGGLRKGMRLPLEEWGATQNLLAGEEVCYRSGNKDCKGFSGIQKSFQQGVKAWLLVPLRFQGDVFGMLAVASKEEDAFKADHVLLAKRFAGHLAVALTNAGNYEKARQRADELAALYDLALEISGQLDLPSLFRTSLLRTTQLLDATMGALFLIDEAMQKMTLVAEHRLPGTPSLPQLKRGQGLAGKVWAEAKAISLWKSRDLGDPRWLEACYSKGAALGVPLYSDGEIRGVLAIYDPAKGRGFHSDEVCLLERMAAQIALGIENVEKHDQIKRRANQLRVVNDLARRIGTVLEQKQLSREIVRRVAQSLNVELVILFIMEGDELVEATTYSLPEDTYGDWEPLRLKIGKEGICSIVASEGEPILVRNIEEDARYIRVLPAESKIQSALAIPLKLKGTVVGVLFTGSEKVAAFDQTDMDAMQALGAHISTSMENAKLYEESKQVQSKLVESEKLRSLGLMTSGIAHDFNNLLSVIMARAELALSQIGNEKVRRHLEQVIASARDAGETIHRLQDFARTPQDTTDFTELDLNQVVKEGIEISRPRWKDQAQSDGIRIEVVTDLCAVKTIFGAAVQLREALVNLIFNALEAMPEGGSLKIRTWMSETGAFLEVSDTGVGMTPEVKEQVFVPFFTTKAGGTGLGLSMVYSAVQRHGGTIDIESQPSLGTAVTIWLPANPTIRIAQNLESKSFLSVKVKPLTILIVEDEEPIRESLTEAFTRAGHHVLSATNGMEGLERFLEADELDIVFTDLGMPRLCGWELIEELRNFDASLPIVILSGWGEEVDPVRVLRYGVSKVITKPFEVPQLHAVLSEVMNSSKENPSLQS